MLFTFIVLFPNVQQTSFSAMPCSLKLECEKLASEKVEIQRHYVMVSSISKRCRVMLYVMLHESLDQINYLFAAACF